MKALVAVRAVLDEERFSEAAFRASAGPFVADANDGPAVGLGVALAPESTVAVSVQPPERAETALRRALALGAASALCVWDDALTDADSSVTAHVLAAAVRRQAVDVVLFGHRSGDTGTGALPAYVATLLKWPSVEGVVAAQYEGQELVVTRCPGTDVREVVAVSLPAVLTLAPGGVSVPYPTVAARIRASRAPLMRLSPDDLALDTAALHPRLTVDRVTLPKPTCAVPMRAAHPSPEVRAALALASPVGSGAALRTGADAVAAALRAFEEAGVIRRGEGVSGEGSVR